MDRLTITLLILPTICALGSSNVFAGEYLGETPPGLEPKMFAVGLLTTALHDDGAPVNTEFSEGAPFVAADEFPSLSPDGKFLFFVSHRGADRSYVFSDLTYDELMQRNLGPMNGEGDVYWVSSQVIHRLCPDLH